MVGEPPGLVFQVPSCSDWQCAKQELRKTPLLLEPEKPLTDATIWSLKSALVYMNTHHSASVIQIIS
jgi:hypothetical protein